MGNKQRKAAPSRQEATLTRIVDGLEADEAVLSLPENLVGPREETVHTTDPSLKATSFSRLAEWKKIKSNSVPFPACYDAVLFTDQSTLFVLAGSTENGSQSVKQYYGYDIEQQNWYVIDLEEALPTIVLGLRDGCDIYFFSATKSAMFTYNTESRQLVRTPLPFSTRHLLSAHAVQGEIYLLRAESESCEFAAAEVYAIDARTWSTRSTEGARPPERSGFATAVYGTCIYVYAGFSQPQGYLDDLWRLDTATMEWQQLSTTGPAVACAGHSLARLCIQGQPYLVAFGGYNGHYLNCAQFFNLHSGEWEVFTCPPVNADKTIGPRTGASTIVLHNKLYVVGGYNGPYYNDVYVLRPRALSLKLLCFEYLHRHAKNFTGLREALPTDLYEEYQRFV